uniref:Uncharacterized protein n=1 Tax=Cajanus cajan TaxID=3821 RepID=A0A151SX61_CAJCA|nr:hypothetical protein KK1_014797 [Cajanus cajan]
MIIMIQSEFQIDKEALRKEFSLEENQPQRSWFLKNYQGFKRTEIQEIYYNFLNSVKLNIPFLDWFHAYTIKKNIDYPFKHDLIGHSTNVVIVWHLKDGEKIQSELPPKTQYQLPQIRDDKNNFVLAAPFKTKDVDENLTSKDIKSIMEQVNYTNKYLQILGDKLAVQKFESSQPPSIQPTSSKHLEKPLFQPFKLSQKTKHTLQKAKAKANIDFDASELLNKINNLLKATTTPDTPQVTEEASSRPKMRIATRTIGVLNQGSDQDSDSSNPPSLQVNPIMTTSIKQWKGLTKPYPSTAFDLAIEDRDLNNSSFNANNIYEWNIDGKSEYNIMHMLQHMTMVCAAYQTAHESFEEAIANIIVSGFIGQLKGRWDHYLTEAQKLGIFSAVKIDDNGEPIFHNGETIPDAMNTLVFTIAQHFIGDPSLWKYRSTELLSNLKCKTLGVMESCLGRQGVTH